MKKLFLSLAALSLALYTSSGAKAAALSADERGYIALAVGGSLASLKCNFKIVEGSLGTFADRSGIDGDTMQAAVQAAMLAMAREKYERADLIPDVTKLVIADVVEVSNAMEKNKTKACSAWEKVLRTQGIMEGD